MCNTTPKTIFFLYMNLVIYNKQTHTPRLVQWIAFRCMFNPPNIKQTCLYSPQKVAYERQYHHPPNKWQQCCRTMMTLSSRAFHVASGTTIKVQCPANTKCSSHQPSIYKPSIAPRPSSMTRLYIYTIGLHAYHKHACTGARTIMSSVQHQNIVLSQGDQSIHRNTLAMCPSPITKHTTHRTSTHTHTNHPFL